MAEPDKWSVVWGLPAAAAPGVGAVALTGAAISGSSSLGFLREVDDMDVLVVDFSRGRRFRGFVSFSFLEVLPFVLASVVSLSGFSCSSSFLRPDRREPPDARRESGFWSAGGS